MSRDRDAEQGGSEATALPNDGATRLPMVLGCGMLVAAFHDSVAAMLIARLPKVIVGNCKGVAWGPSVVDLNRATP